MYQDSCLQPPLTLQNRPVQHRYTCPATVDFQSPGGGGNKKQPARACKLGTTLAFFDSHLKILLERHVLVLMHSP